jgi:hypothetical protein
MSTLSTPLNRVEPRARLAGPAILALVLAFVVVAAVIIAMNASAANIGGSSAAYNAPYYSEYLQDMAHGW